MTGGGPGVSLSPVSGGGTVQPWHHTWHGAEKKQPSINGGGERGGVHRGIDQTRHYTLPIPLKNPSLVEYGGGEGQGVFTVASPKHGTAHHLPPPRKTHASWNGGGGGGVHRGVAQARH